MESRFKYGSFWKGGIIVVSSFIILFLLIPVCYIITWALTGESGIVTLTNRVTLHWFFFVFTDKTWLSAISISIVYASLASSISLTITLIYYYYSFWYRRTYQYVGYFLIILPLFFPILIYALALKIAGSVINLPESVEIILGHIAVIIPIQYLILEGSNEKVKLDWLYCSTVMGANHWEIITKIIIPNIITPLLIALGCGFLFSFDEIVISNFIIDSGNITVPKKIWLEINRDINPSSGVIYFTLLFINILIITIISFFRKRKINFKMGKNRLFKTMFFRDIWKTIASGVFAAILAVILEYIIAHHISILPAILSFIFVAFLYEISNQLIMINVWGYDIIDKIFSFRNTKHEKYKQLAIGMLSFEIETPIKEIDDFFSNKKGVVVNNERHHKIVELLFSKNKGGYYFGTDSNVPSEFYKLYPNYLTHSQDWITSTRILLCERTVLQQDLQNHKSDFEMFYNWHQKNNANLISFSKQQAETIKTNIQGLEYTDIGIFNDDYVVVFKPESVDHFHYWFYSLSNQTETIKYIRFLLQLIQDENAKIIKYEVNNNSLTFLDIPIEIKNEIVEKLTNLWNLK